MTWIGIGGRGGIKLNPLSKRKKVLTPPLLKFRTPLKVKRSKREEWNRSHRKNPLPHSLMTSNIKVHKLWNDLMFKS